MKSAVASLLFLADYSTASGSTTTWDYDHMSAWSNEFSMCGVDHQSPINVKPHSAIFDQDICDSTFEWDIDFTKTSFKIANNGHSLSLKPVEETNIDADSELEDILYDSDDVEYIALTENENCIAKLKNYFKPDDSEHEYFCLDSFHFHWGTDDDTGSEHRVDGYQYPLELHFVHYSCSHSSLGSCLEQFPTMESVVDAEDEGVDTHQLGVVGIFFDVVDDRTNPAFDAMFDNATFDDIIYPAEHSSHSTVITGLNLTDLIPENVWTAGYYAYEGSLTTPPCTDIVRWHVMNARGYIGRSQLAMFRELMSTEKYPIAPNFREIQTNPATVYGCMGETLEEETGSTSTTSELSWWAIAIISSLGTAAVMGFVFLFIYKQQEREMHENENFTKKAEMEKRRTSSDMFTTR